MSYLTLARRYRPRRFEDVRGQEPVVRALSHALDGDRLHPALLLTGTRGVGKTTLGRIVAKSLNCEKGVSAHPCGECSACHEVDDGRFIDLIEIDAASRTKVEDTRQLLDNVAYAPARGRYKVYLIDEVHMLSASSFNALLKTLEEPPPHVKFILATTDPQKLPVTVLSRCLKFNLRRLPVSLIREQLAQVLTAEKLEADAAALTVLARGADGSMRDGLSLLDQAIAYAGGARLERDAMEAMLGTVGRRGLLDLVAAIAAGDGGKLLAGLEALTAVAPDYSTLLDMLGADLQRVATLQLLPAAADPDDDPQLVQLATQIAAEDVQIYYEIAVHARRDLRWAPDPRIGFEMALLRMYAFRPVDAAKPVEAGRPVAGRVAAPAATTPAARAVGAPSPAAVPPLAAPPPASTPPPQPPASQLTAAPDPPLSEVWPTDITGLKLAGLAHELAMHCALARVEGDTVHLEIAPAFAHLVSEARRAEIEQALSAARGTPWQVRIAAAGDASGTPLDTPARAAQRQVKERQARAQAAAENSAAARALRENFGATLRPGSVTPVD
ncbi:MAG TPA: DNA polymerase III subunit gamma/tau [Nevskiaceae bacterium]|nr:DNA polymerase III subunit gamma/tau [Nevskiaceae bacterium]